MALILARRGFDGSPNQALHRNRRSPFRVLVRSFLGRWIGCQRPVPAAVGELTLGLLDACLQVKSR